MTSDRQGPFTRGLPPGLWLVVMALGIVLGSAGVIEAAEQKSVLVLYANRRDSQVAIVGERNLPRLLDEGLPAGLDYYSEYLDAGRFAELTYQSALSEFLKLKYAGKRLDLVVAMQDLAVEFVRTHGAALFPGTPVVFFAGSPATARMPNSTGVIGPVNFSGSLKLALALQPDTRDVYVIIGANSGDRSYETLLRAQFAAFEPRVRTSYLVGVPTRALERQLAALPPHSIVYYVVVDKDGAGHIFHPLAYLERVAAVANAPTYSWVESAMDHGIVGGSLKSHTLQMEAIARLALRVLQGERADAVPTVSPNLNVLQVDWRQLRRWGISESRVPAGTIVKFREPTAWDSYGNYILGGVVVLLTQTLLITGLLVQRTRRQRVEAQLRSQKLELHDSYERIRDINHRLLSAQDTERGRIARELHDDISQQVALLEIDLEQLNGTVDADGGRLAGQALQRAEHIAKSVHGLSHRLHPAKLQLLGLLPALDGLREELSRSDTEITITHESVAPALTPEQTLCLFRVAQEALQNALKHSGSRRVSVDLRDGADGLTLTIADDGSGFDVGKAWGKGLGLISIAERLEAISGTLAIASTAGVGTRMEVRIPYSGGGAQRGLRPDEGTGRQASTDFVPV